MGLIKGGAMRLFSTGLYFITFVAGAIMTGATAWFIVSFRGSKRDLAIVGISAVSMAYSFVAMLLTCCLAGLSFFALLGAIIDLFLFGAMIAVAVLNRDGRFGCGPGDGTTCRLYVATFVLAIISLIAYLINGVVSVLVRRSKKTPVTHHDKYRY
ncbi:hypothetical protein NLU13_0044 [Sarocladium strictum]|uniref:MARVEL domain-containing protein n=1 Tax=Sarocladium strictum TaxID=5046 RepID=A0AA39GNC3_SARSR|nr:hypothetical protein NLU13_0044 [Sarocladium strictum]